ncbi:MAG TPA: hypothetical protein VFG09_13360, partial [Thermodesulfovibrionales bacterium]|nr:hypothetical protein [Thermodesulfovibrionales bacterium]
LTGEPNSRADANLAALSTTGYVDQVLYYYSTPDVPSDGIGLTAVSLRTYADGHTEFNPLGADNCAAVLSDDLSLHIPVLIFHSQAYWIDFSYVPNTLNFVATAAGVVSDTTPYSCSPSTLSDSLKLHMPVLMFHNVSYWLDMIYGGGLTFTATGAGVN